MLFRSLGGGCGGALAAANVVSDFATLAPFPTVSISMDLSAVASSSAPRDLKQERVARGLNKMEQGETASER